MVDNGYIITNGWVKGVAFYVTSSVIGSASKLVVRKSWLMINDTRSEGDEYASQETENDDSDEAASLISPYKLDEGEERELESSLHTRNSIVSFGQQSEEGEKFLGQENNQVTVVNNETKRIWNEEQVPGRKGPEGDKYASQEIEDDDSDEAVSLS